MECKIGSNLNRLIPFNSIQLRMPLSSFLNQLVWISLFQQHSDLSSVCKYESSHPLRSTGQNEIVSKVGRFCRTHKLLSSMIHSFVDSFFWFEESISLESVKIFENHQQHTTKLHYWLIWFCFAFNWSRLLNQYNLCKYQIQDSFSEFEKFVNYLLQHLRNTSTSSFRSHLFKVLSSFSIRFK